LFGKPRDDAFVDKILAQVGLADKADNKIVELSGGMKRRVLIAKALAHEPRVLFLDEPTAGVDVELRKEMWEVVDTLRKSGVTVILTTHYIEEAEAMADRVAVIDKGQIMLVEKKEDLMQKMGRKTLTVHLAEPVTDIPAALADFDLELAGEGTKVNYTYDTRADRTGITKLLAEMSAAGLQLADLETKQSSLEEIFVGLVKEKA
jgi:ABC-2 type transport system ATP-binding protein